MVTVRTYQTRIEADVSRVLLESHGIHAVVIGLDAGMAGYGGIDSVRLQVAESQQEAALEILKDKAP